MPLDLHTIRTHFPALNRPEIFLDNPGGTQVASSCIDRIVSYYKECNANHGGMFTTSQKSDALIEDTRQAMADFINAACKEEIVFGPNMTTLTFHISRSLGRMFKPGDTIVVTHMDHDGNISPWLMLAEDYNLRVRWVDFHPENGTLNLEDLQAALEEKPRLVAFGYASNFFGTVNPVAKITQMAHEAGALVYVDAVQYVPHAPVDVQKLGVDFLVCSAYKFYGPHLGILYGRHELLERLTAYKVRPAPADPPGKFETGTGLFENIAGLLGALEYIQWLGHTYGEEQHELYAGQYTGRKLTFKTAMAAIHAYDLELNRALLKTIQNTPGVKIYGVTDARELEQRVPTFSFTKNGLTPEEAAKKLAQQGIFVWNGNFYALAITQRLSLEEKGGVIRVGAVHYNTIEEITRLEKALQTL